MSEWIPVNNAESDVLPEKFEQVLVCLCPVEYPRSNYMLAWQKRGIWFGLFTDPVTGNVRSGEIPEDQITHWMRLPAAPLPQPERKDE